MNYNIEEILKSVFSDDESNQWNPSEKIPLLNKEIEKYKTDIKQYLSNSSYDIPELIKESKELCATSNDLIQEMEACKKEIEDVTMVEILKSIESHDLIADELETIKFTLDIIFDVVQSGKYLKQYDDSKKEGKLYSAAEALTDLTTFLNHPTEGFNELAICANLKNSLDALWEEFLGVLDKKFEYLFSWNKEDGNRRNTININMLFEITTETTDLLQALRLCKRTQSKVDAFGEFLMNEVLVPIIHQDCTVFAETDEKMTITVPQNTQNKPTHDAVITNLRILFHHLSNKLNVKYISDDETFMSLLGKKLCIEFSDVLINDCLIDTIPNSVDELQYYGRITSEIEDFQRFMVLVGFFPEENFNILCYTENIDVLFASRSSEFFLETARNIMLKDLSATMSIGVERIPETNDTTWKIE